jgi:Uma2 family endonuclease
VGPLARDAGLAPRLGIFSLGEPNDYCVPDGALLRPGADAVYVPTEALLVEVVSPDDDTWEKLEFYAAHHVGELLIVEPEKRQIERLASRSGASMRLWSAAD